MKTIPTSKTPSLFWGLAGIPLLLGTAYVLVYFFGFQENIHFVEEHYLTLAFWTVNTVLLTEALYIFTRHWGAAAATRLAFLVPATSYSLLFFIYLCALIGNFKWGSVTTYDVVFRFLGDLFNLGYETGIHPSIPLAAIAGPTIGFTAYFQWKGPHYQEPMESLAGAFDPTRSTHSKRNLLAGGAAWALVAVSLFSHNPHLKFFGHFRFDPVVGFFENSRFQFSLNAERMQAAERDRVAAAAIHPHPPRARNVVLFVVDALRADHLPAYGYARPITPYLSSLEHQPLYRKVDWTLSTGSESATGQMAIMSSKETRDISHLVYSLPDNFSDNGFRTIFFYSGDSVWCNFDKSFGKKIDIFVDGAAHPGPGGVSDDRMLLELMDKVKPDDGGLHFFCFHLMSVHEAGFLQDAFLRYKPVVNLASYFFHPQTPQFITEKQGAINMYDDRILQADAIISQLMNQLGKKGYLRDYVGVLTADHGQKLGEKGQFGHGRFVSPGILRVPLIFFGSKPLPAFAQNRFATLLDVAPTLVELQGLQVPFSWQGQSLIHPRTQSWSYHLSPSPREGNRGAVVYYDGRHIYKYSRPLSPQTTSFKERVTDLISDSTAHQNILDHIDPTLLAQMRRQANEHFVVY